MEYFVDVLMNGVRRLAASRSVWTGLIICAILVLTLGSMFSIRRVRQSLLQRAIRDTTLTAESFATAVAQWLDEDELSTLQRVAQIMLAGSSLYVHVVDRGSLILREDHPALNTIVEPLNLQIEALSRTEVSFVRFGSTWCLDARVPLTKTEIPQGYIRIGTDVGFLKGKVVSTGLQVGGASAGIVTLLCGLAWGMQRRYRSSHDGVSLPVDGEAVDPASDEPRNPLDMQRGPLRIDISLKSASLNGQSLSLPPKLYTLLCLLAENDHRVVAENEIVEAIWPPSFRASSNDVRQCIHRLRKGLREASPGAERSIVNVKGFGYRFDRTNLSESPRGAEDASSPTQKGPSLERSIE